MHYTGEDDRMDVTEDYAPREDADIRSFAAYQMDEDGIGSTPVTTYSSRLKELGLSEEPRKVGLARDFTAEPGVRIAVRDYEPVLDQDRAVIISCPMDVDVEDVLPDEVFDNLRTRQVGVYQDDNFDTYVSARKQGWKETGL